MLEFGKLGSGISIFLDLEICTLVDEINYNFVAAFVGEETKGNIVNLGHALVEDAIPSILYFW